MKMKNIFLAKKKEALRIYSLSFIGVLGQTGSAVMLTKSMDMLINQEISGFVLNIILSISCWLIALIVVYFNNLNQEKFIQAVASDLRLHVANQIKRIELTSIEKFNSSYYVNMIISDLPLIEKGISNHFVIVISLFSIGLASITMIYFHFSIFLTAVIFGSLLLILPTIFQKEIKQKMSEVSTENEKLHKNITNWFEGVSELASFNSINLLDIIIKKQSASMTEKKVAQTKLNSRMTLVIALLNIMSQFVIITLTGLLAINNLVTFGAIFAVGNLASQLFTPLSDISTRYSDIFATKSLLEKVRPEKSAVKKITSHPLKKGILLKNLSYQYPDKTINYPDIFLEKGGNYLLKGSSGAGKSTLLGVINGSLENYQGEVYWDYRSYRQLDPRELKNSLTNVSQKITIFNTSVKKNIILESAFDQVLFEDVIKKSCLSKTIEELVLKEETLLDSEEELLSGGELQRITVARALYHKKQLILLDEATASLDRETADIIESFMFNDLELTVLLITHNISQKINDYQVKIIDLDS